MGLLLLLTLTLTVCRGDAAFARVSAQWVKRRLGLGLRLGLEP